MSEPKAREWLFYVDDMIRFAEKAIAYTKDLDQEGFAAGGLNHDATLRNLELIGEAATHVPDAVRAANPHIPWRLMIATRNRLPAHHLSRLAAAQLLQCMKRGSCLVLAAEILDPWTLARRAYVQMSPVRGRKQVPQAQASG